MIRAFFYSRKWFWWAYGGALFLLLSLYAQVHMSVLINKWYGGFYDILQEAHKHRVEEFWAALSQFFYIAMPYVFIATVTSYFTRLYSLRWREAITFDYIPRWRTVKEEIEGASQRIQEDAYRFARIVETLGLQVVRAVMTLVAFLPILWSLSERVDAPFIQGAAVTLKDKAGATLLDKSGMEVVINYIPGSLVWTALFVSIGGMVVSWFVGIKLPGLEYNNQKVEAAFRKELVLGEDDKTHHALPALLAELFVGVRFNYQRLFLHYGYFDVWSNLYDQVMIIVPYIIAGPGLFTGAVMLGFVVQVSNAFQKVHGSFSLFINNWTTVTELRSIWKRLHEFEANLDKHKTT
ncbi:MAG: putative transporter [Candidatus Liptonbacteria bacterium]|nr:putative transporter [Candidatus Liptonbacteria bacterium]